MKQSRTYVLPGDPQESSSVLCHALAVNAHLPETCMSIECLAVIQDSRHPSGV